MPYKILILKVIKKKHTYDIKICRMYNMDWLETRLNKNINNKSYVRAFCY